MTAAIVMLYVLDALLFLSDRLLSNRAARR